MEENFVDTEHSTDLTIGNDCNCSDQQVESTVIETSCKSLEDNGKGSSSSKYMVETYDTGSSSCSSCSTRRNSSCESDFEITFSSLFRTPSTNNSTSHSSNLSSPIGRQSSDALEGIDSLLRRITSERFAELRNIQLSERPVTNGNARDNIETFFRRAVYGPTEEERHLLEDANRPAEVVNDVQLLQQRSVVQSALQNEFSRILERALLTRLSPPQTTAPPPQHVPQRRRNLVGGSDFRSRLESLYGARSTTTASPPVVRPTRTSTATSRQNVQSHSTSQSIPPAPPTPGFTRGIPAAPPAPGSTHIPAAPPIPTDNEESATSNFSVTIDAGLQLLAQNIADDLHTLESLQVVSNMLTGGFRSHLETMVQQRINDESAGNRTQQFISSLPGRRPTTHATTTSTRPQSHAVINAGVSAELDVLKNQMEEMKRMLAMSMEIQMDTQRAIRQEVSAVFSTFMQDYLMPRAASAPTQPTVTHPPVSTPVASGQCVICIDRSVDTVLYQCGHMCVCNQCGLQLKIDGHNCPMCRAPIRDVIRAYQTQ